MSNLLCVVVLTACAAAAALAGGEVQVRAYGVMPNGERRPNVKIVREEVERTTLLPLLPYVFFDSASSTIPQRYVRFGPREARVFAERSVTRLDAYYQVLNLIGRRLRDTPEASVTLVGSTDGREGAEVAAARVTAVQSYLMETWSLGAERFTVDVRALPTAVTTTGAGAISAQENRRVTIEGPWTITQPVVVRDTTTTISPPSIEFTTTCTIADVAGFAINAWQDDYEAPLYAYEHVSVPQHPRVWHLDRDPAAQPRSDEDLQYEASVEDAAHRRYTSDLRAIPVDQITLQRKKHGEYRGSTEIHQYDLILFDFASGSLRADHELIIDQMIADEGTVQPTSAILIYGYTDSTGTADLNLRLSVERAASTASRILQRFADVLAPSSVSYEGRGMADVVRLPTGLALPEARMYARTVQIIVMNRRAP